MVLIIDLGAWWWWQWWLLLGNVTRTWMKSNCFLTTARTTTRKTHFAWHCINMQTSDQLITRVRPNQIGQFYETGWTRGTRWQCAHWIAEIMFVFALEKINLNSAIGTYQESLFVAPKWAASEFGSGWLWACDWASCWSLGPCCSPPRDCNSLAVGRVDASDVVHSLRRWMHTWMVDIGLAHHCQPQGPLRCRTIDQLRTNADSVRGPPRNHRSAVERIVAVVEGPDDCSNTVPMLPWRTHPCPLASDTGWPPTTVAMVCKRAMWSNVCTGQRGEWTIHSWWASLFWQRDDECWNSMFPLCELALVMVVGVTPHLDTLVDHRSIVVWSWCSAAHSPRPSTRMACQSCWMLPLDGMMMMLPRAAASSSSWSTVANAVRMIVTSSSSSLFGEWKRFVLNASSSRCQCLCNGKHFHEWHKVKWNKDKMNFFSVLHFWPRNQSEQTNNSRTLITIQGTHPTSHRRTSWTNDLRPSSSFSPFMNHPGTSQLELTSLRNLFSAISLLPFLFVLTPCKSNLTIMVEVHHRDRAPFTAKHKNL